VREAKQLGAVAPEQKARAQQIHGRQLLQRGLLAKRAGEEIGVHSVVFSGHSPSYPEPGESGDIFWGLSMSGIKPASLDNALAHTHTGEQYFKHIPSLESD